MSSEKKKSSLSNFAHTLQHQFRFENGRKLAQLGILPVFSRFWAKRGSNIIQFEFWDKIWNPLMKAHLLDHKMKGDLKFYFLAPNRNFKTWVPMYTA